MFHPARPSLRWSMEENWRANGERVAVGGRQGGGEADVGGVHSQGRQQG